MLLLFFVFSSVNKHSALYLSRNTLSELYKLYVRPHLDYGDVIYHVPQRDDCSGNYLMEKLESVQYSTALVVTGTWRGTSQERLYNELGWESLSSRRWSRRLILFYKFINNLTPDYTRDLIPPLHETSYPFRNQPVVGQIRSRTEKFRSSFYPDCLFEWNNLDPELREPPSVSILKKKLFLHIRLPAKSVYGIHNPKGIAYLTQLRVGLSKLNFHKFKHNFQDTVNPMCSINDGIEDTEHFLLLCNSFTEQRHDLLAGVNDLLEAYGYSEALDNNILQLLLYGNKNFPLEANRLILNATMNYIFETERFD